ncbi:hypothetical protein EV681_3072 [Advenella incenata]|uniref:Uncharacterized protein n=1 Tax=Advenella incenata TaxID=267800 RepID=A0A4Q7VCN4_9BURK|nr:hypothetical protein EV681_3072 [Advenella incenata]
MPIIIIHVPLNDIVPRAAGNRYSEVRMWEWSRQRISARSVNRSRALALNSGLLAGSAMGRLISSRYRLCMLKSPFLNDVVRRGG